ncbi:MAG: response regulator [Ancalomicrobiaceae bacterium]|nr:response regulator [Ancalomicrobiaceae bacterium]
MNAQPHVLIVEDDHEIRSLVARYLGANDCRVSQARDGREMDRVLGDSRIDAVILDIMLPGEDGLTLCRRLRQAHDLPVVMLSAKGDEIDRIVGLEVGADDYLAKPFNPRELLARLRAVLRRSTGSRSHTAIDGARRFTFAGWTLDALTGVLLDPQATRVTITGAELLLLKAFCERPGRVLARDQLIELTQGRQNGSSERSIDILVSRLRSKIVLDPPAGDLIRTIRSGGYVFTPDVSAES